VTRKKADLLKETSDLLILRTLDLEPLNGWAISKRIHQMSDGVEGWPGIPLSRRLSVAGPGPGPGPRRGGHQPDVLPLQQGGPSAPVLSP